MSDWTEQKKLKQKQRLQERSEYIRSKKTDVPCHDCGGKFPPYCMDFHHLNEGTKHYALKHRSFVDKMSTCSIKRIDEELSKCVIVCANCHRIRHNT
jgi:hypothetical protein